MTSSKTSASGSRVGDVVEDRDRDLERHHPVVPPADQQDARARMPARSGGRTRGYAGMRTFISEMPWIRFEEARFSFSTHSIVVSSVKISPRLGGPRTTASA